MAAVDPAGRVESIEVESVLGSAGRGDAPRALGRWVLRRVGIGLLTLWVASVVVFAGTQALPSDPARAILGRDATPQLLATLRDQLGLNRSVVAQYWSWLSGLFHGDLGTSLASRTPVSGLIGFRLVNSVELLLMVAVVLIPLSVFLGSITAVRRDTFFDRFTMRTSITLMAMPDFIIATLAVTFFATTVFQLLPATTIIPSGTTPIQAIGSMILPVLTVTAISLPFHVRLVRASMIEVLESDHIQMARLRGVSDREIIWRNALPNALVPMIQSMSLTLSMLLGGSVIVEFIFNFPGLGQLFASSIGVRDLPTIQALTLLFTAGVVAFNLVADILTVFLTPKLRTLGGLR